MDKERVIEFLKTKVKEIPHLINLDWKNVEYPIWRDDIQYVLKEAFGAESSEYNKFYNACKSYKYDPPYRDYGELLRKLELTINSIITTYEITKIDSNGSNQMNRESNGVYAIGLFDAMQFHSRIINASRALFEDAHYTQAIFEAFKAVENFVKKKSGSNLYGKQLMATVFNEDKPIIQVPEAGHFDKDVQEGFKFLFMGGTLGIRNPKAHQEIIQKDPFITLEYLGFASFLIKRIDY